MVSYERKIVIPGGGFGGIIPAYVIRSLVHIYLAGSRNRRRVFVEWIWSYFTLNRGVKLITDRLGCTH